MRVGAKESPQHTLNMRLTSCILIPNTNASTFYPDVAVSITTYKPTTTVRTACLPCLASSCCNSMLNCGLHSCRTLTGISGAFLGGFLSSFSTHCSSALCSQSGRAAMPSQLMNKECLCGYLDMATCYQTGIVPLMETIDVGPSSTSGDYPMHIPRPAALGRYGSRATMVAAQAAACTSA